MATLAQASSEPMPSVPARATPQLGLPWIRGRVPGKVMPPVPEADGEQEHDLQAEHSASAIGETDAMVENVKREVAAIEAAQAQEARRAERAEQAREQERKRTLRSFFMKEGFQDISVPRRTIFCARTYPLHCAARKGNLKVVEVLLRAGADPLQMDSRGHTAEDVVRKKNYKNSHVEIVRLLHQASDGDLPAGDHKVEAPRLL